MVTHSHCIHTRYATNTTNIVITRLSHVRTIHDVIQHDNVITTHSTTISYLVLVLMLVIPITSSILTLVNTRTGWAAPSTFHQHVPGTLLPWSLATLLRVRHTTPIYQDGNLRQVQWRMPHLVLGCTFNASSRRAMDLLEALRYDLLPNSSTMYEGFLLLSVVHM